jgi:hypothetical protein
MSHAAYLYLVRKYFTQRFGWGDPRWTRKSNIKFCMRGCKIVSLGATRIRRISAVACICATVNLGRSLFVIFNFRSSNGFGTGLPFITWADPILAIPPTCTEIRFCSNYHPAVTKESVPKAQLLESRVQRICHWQLQNFPAKAYQNGRQWQKMAGKCDG